MVDQGGKTLDSNGRTHYDDHPVTFLRSIQVKSPRPEELATPGVGFNSLFLIVP